MKESAHACKGVEGVMHDQRNWGELECVPGVRMGGQVWVLWVEGR